MWPNVAGDDEAVAHLQSILETVVDAVITIDERGKIRLANRAVQTIFGYAPEELLGQNINTLMTGHERDEHDEYLRSYLRTGQAKIIGIGREVTGRRRDGSLICLDLAVSEIRIGERRLFTGVLRDMTERNRVADALQQERSFIERLMSTVHAVVLVLAPDGRIARFNSYLARISGYEEQQVLNADWIETFLLPGDRQRVRSIFEGTLKGTPMDGNVNTFLTSTGRELLIAWSACRLTDSSGQVTGILAIGNDITALKAAEARLIQSERLAAIGQMVTGLAHESRNALQRATASLEMLQLDLPPRQDSMRQVTQINSALDELRRLYEEVRAYAAPIHLDYRNCNLAELHRNAWDYLEPLHAGRNVSLRLDFAAGTMAACQCDRERIVQVARNILENALAVAPEGSEIVVQGGQCLLHEFPAFRTTIRDAGPGMTPEQQARVFEPFFTTKSKGTGLGMAIVRRVVEAHRGEVTIRNANDRGVEVEVTLPLSPPST
ncbi:MAG: PAS domain S-box protein [Planctomycetaceae bacterium]